MGRKYAKYLNEKPLGKINSSNYWSNKFFIVTDASLSNENLDLEIEKPKYMISHEETNDACITWHSHKKLYQKLSTYKNYFVLLKLMISKLEEVPELILLTINEQNVSGIHQNPQLIVHLNLMYRLSFSKTVFIRKPYPFPSRCTFKTKQHKLAGLYNQKVCKLVNNNPELVIKFDNQDQSCPLVCKDTSFYFSTAVIKEIKQPCKNDKVKLSNGNLPKCEEEVKTDTIEFLNYQFLLTPQHPKSIRL